MEKKHLKNFDGDPNDKKLFIKNKVIPFDPSISEKHVESINFEFDPQSKILFKLKTKKKLTIFFIICCIIF